ncbi:hypothetical protein KFE25_012124 [Diacronema lutheri]|uniref:Serine hydrolase domain-containing protein n=1 Tax=Diacronema lutheri TaxID=2081491 RepID=A0A8J5XKM7_DIALT|nr:hypothetical protein KFE25_012124 [Diacronema lutheri]
MAPASSSSAVPRLLRVLCLHGYGQCGDVLRARTGALRKGLKGVCEFTFVDAPHAATAAWLATPDAADGDATGPKLAWWNAASDDGEGVRPSQSKVYVGWDESLCLLERIVEAQGPFDGILAFSQGAAAGAILLAALNAKGARSALPAFAILVSGFLPRDEQVGTLLRNGPHVPVPTLHVCGDADALVPPGATEALSACFAAPLIFRHNGGHAVPGNAQFRSAARAFVEGPFAAANAGAAPARAPAAAPAAAPAQAGAAAERVQATTAAGGPNAASAVPAAANGDT